MPIYEYKCHDCGKVFEVIQKISDKKLTICRCDEKGTVHRLVSSSGFRLKGSGWYETDFKTKKPDTKKTDS
jgi:putative FmdB family regulatory protein